MAKSNSAKKEKVKHFLSRNVEEVIDRNHLEAALLSGKKLRVKHGIDPTGEKIHIGRAVVLWKLKEFQGLGHKIALVIGDFTAQIGDPSDKLEKRPFLSREQVEKNMKQYLSQIARIIDLKKTEVHYNSEWLSKLNFRETVELAETFTVNQMLRRRNFRKRWDKGEEISVREFLYPVMQGYDSVMVKADVELGGTDQLFNLMAGRGIQKHYGQEPQDIMVTKMLPGTDGRKMSTSWGNVINIFDSADEQFGKIMALRDELVFEYFRMATLLPEKEIAAHERALRSGANPKDIKLILAKEIAALYHGKAAAEKAAERWGKLFSKKDISSSIGLPILGVDPREKLFDVIVKSKAVSTKSMARRLIKQRSVSQIRDGKNLPPIENIFSGCQFLQDGDILKIGKKHFFRVKVQK